MPLHRRRQTLHTAETLRRRRSFSRSCFKKLFKKLAGGDLAMHTIQKDRLTALFSLLQASDVA